MANTNLLVMSNDDIKELLNIKTINNLLPL